MPINRFYPSKTALGIAALLACTVFGAPAQAQGGPTVQANYRLSVFVKSTSAYSQPDSIVRWRHSILVGYQNHVAKDGTDGGFSTIVQYGLDGTAQRTFQVKGHNDGLRIVGEDHLWALQNEDANPNLVVINLESGHQKAYTFPPTPHGGGYDDMAIKDGHIFVTASNPNLDSNGVNDFPALVEVHLDGDTVDVTPVLNGNAAAFDIPTGKAITLNLTDPDSLTIDPRGNILLDDQQDGELVFIRKPLSPNPIVGQLTLTLGEGSGPGSITVDDTAFPRTPRDFLLFSDVGAGIVYRLDSRVFGFEPGVPYSASDTGGFVAVLNLDSGLLTPIGTGFQSTRGMIFVSPASEDVDDHDDDR